MKQTFEIKCRLESYNEHENSRRGNKYAGGSSKKRNQNMVKMFVRMAKLQPVDCPQWVAIEWHEDTTGRKRGRDPDNIASAKKFILDALKDLGIIKEDTHKYIAGFTDSFVFEPKPCKAVVTLYDYWPFDIEEE